MKRWIGAAVAAGTVLLAGCGQSAAPEPVSVPSPSPRTFPASNAGGACHLLDYATIREQLDVAFDVAAARKSGETHTCVVRATAVSLPDLVLTVTPISTSEQDFAADVVPDEADEVEGLGRSGYRVVRPANRDRGPVVEVGWLAGDGRLVTVRFTLAEGADDPEAYLDGLVALATSIDRARV